MILLIPILFLLSLSYSKDLALVSVYPFYDVVKHIGESRFYTEVLIPPKADYHHYELSVSDILKVSKAEIVFVSGVPLGGWEQKIEEISKGKVVRLSEGMELIRMGSIGVDPHIWLSPKRMVSVAKKAYEGFVSIDPEGKETLRRNLREVLEKLEDLDRLYSSTLARCRVRVLPVVHPALGYLAKDYGLEQVYLSGGHVHGGISPKEMLRFVKEIESRGLDFVLTIYGQPSKIASILRSEYGIKTYEINVKIIPMDGNVDYFSIMEYNLSVLREALRCM